MRYLQKTKTVNCCGPLSIQYSTVSAVEFFSFCPGSTYDEFTLVSMPFEMFQIYWFVLSLKKSGNKMSDLIEPPKCRFSQSLTTFCTRNFKNKKRTHGKLNEAMQIIAISCTQINIYRLNLKRYVHAAISSDDVNLLLLIKSQNNPLASVMGNNLSSLLSNKGTKIYRIF